jgi:SNF2 family DNA or RNA helicase
MTTMTFGKVTANIGENTRFQPIIALESSWNLSFQLREVPGARYVARLDRYEMPLSWSSCIMLREEFGKNLVIGPELKEWARSEKELRINPALELRELIELDVEPDELNDHDERLYPFQRVGREFLIAARDVLLGDEQGTGKTVQVLAALRKTDAYPALVICPNTLKRNWEAEVNLWLPEAEPFVVHGSAKQKRDVLANSEVVANAVVIINIESMRMFSRLASYSGVRNVKCSGCDRYGGSPDVTPAKCESHPKELNTMMFKTVVLDEAHRVKDPRAKQTRAIWSVMHGPEVEYRYALTGTPIANHPGDLWSIMHGTAKGDFPARTAYIDRYAQQSWNAFGSMDIVGLRSDKRDEFFKIFNPRFRRMQKAVVLPQLPPKVRTIRLVEMAPKQRKAYDELSKELVTRLDDGSLLIARNNLTAATRLLQLSSSYCEVDRGETPEDPATWTVTPTAPSSKIDELIAIIEENEGKSIAVAAEHRKLLVLAEEALTKKGITSVSIHGTVDADERARNLKMFQDGHVQVIMFTYKAGGVGLTMTRADTLVRLQRSWSLVDNLQGEDRVHRIGSETHESINIIDIVAENTVEVQQCMRLYDKSQRMEEIVRDREQLIKHGLPTTQMDEELERLESAFLGG